LGIAPWLAISAANQITPFAKTNDIINDKYFNSGEPIKFPSKGHQNQPHNVSNVFKKIQVFDTRTRNESLKEMPNLTFQVNIVATTRIWFSDMLTCAHDMSSKNILQCAFNMIIVY
jgi:hypothetical protein